MKQHGFSARGPPLVANKEKQSNPNVSVILNMDLSLKGKYNEDFMDQQRWWWLCGLREC